MWTKLSVWLYIRRPVHTPQCSTSRMSILKPTNTHTYVCICRCILYGSILLRVVFNAPSHTSATSMQAATSCVVCSVVRRNQSGRCALTLAFTYIHWMGECVCALVGEIISLHHFTPVWHKMWWSGFFHRLHNTLKLLLFLCAPRTHTLTYTHQCKHM